MARGNGAVTERAADHYTVRHAVILAHPSSSSFSAAIAGAYCETVSQCGQEAIIRDLYRLGFDPLLKEEERPHEADCELLPDVRQELAILEGTDVFVLVYPVWFGMPPAMMTGYLDRVLGAGVTPSQVQNRAGRSIMSGHRLLSITSSGASKIWLDEQGQREALYALTSRYWVNAFGLKSADTLHFGEVTDGLAADFIDQNLQDVQDRAKSICAEMAADRSS